MKISLNDCAALKKTGERTNLKNVELSKKSLRMFLEKEILAHANMEFAKSNVVGDVTSPETPHDLCEIEFSLYPCRLTLLPLEEIAVVDELDPTNYSNGDEHFKFIENVDKNTFTVVNHENRNRDYMSAIVMHESHFASERHRVPADNLSSATKKENPSVESRNIETSRIEQDLLPWHESCALNDETISIEGSLSGSSISRASLCKIEPPIETTLRKCRRKLGSIFCCLG